jgi:hypothetical protein
MNEENRILQSTYANGYKNHISNIVSVFESQKCQVVWDGTVSVKGDKSFLRLGTSMDVSFETPDKRFLLDWVVFPSAHIEHSSYESYMMSYNLVLYITLKRGDDPSKIYGLVDQYMKMPKFYSITYNQIKLDTPLYDVSQIEGSLDWSGDDAVIEIIFDDNYLFTVESSKNNDLRRADKIVDQEIKRLIYNPRTKAKF